MIVAKDLRMAKYRVRDAFEAIEFKGFSLNVDDLLDMEEWISANKGEQTCRYVGGNLVVSMLDGTSAVARPGDWLMRVGSLLRVAPGPIFHRLYEPA